MTVWTLPPRQLITSSFITALATEMGGANRVGDHDAPSGAFPYNIVYAIEGGTVWGAPFDSAERSISMVYQVSSVGTQRTQAQWWADRGREFILGWNDTTGTFLHDIPLPTGWTVCGRLGEAAASGLLVEGNAPTQVFTAPQRFILQVTSA